MDAITYILVVAVFLLASFGCGESSLEEYSWADGNHTTAMQRNTFDIRLKKLLEEFRDNMTQPNPHLGLPTLDPLNIDSIPLNLHLNCMTNTGLLRGLQVEGLSTFVIDKLHLLFIGPHISFRFYVEKIIATGSYNYSLNLSDDLPLLAGNSLTFEADDVVIGGDILIASNDSANHNVYIKSFSLEVFYGTTLVDVGESEDPLSDALGVILSKIFAKSLDKSKPELVNYARDKFVSFANERLQNTTLSDIISELSL